MCLSVYELYTLCFWYLLTILPFSPSWCHWGTSYFSSRRNFFSSHFQEIGQELNEDNISLMMTIQLTRSKKRQVERMCLSMFRISMIVLKMTELVRRANRRKSLSHPENQRYKFRRASRSGSVEPIRSRPVKSWPMGAEKVWRGRKSTQNKDRHGS